MSSPSSSFLSPLPELNNTSKNEVINKGTSVSQVPKVVNINNVNKQIPTLTFTNSASEDLINRVQIINIDDVDSGTSRNSQNKYHRTVEKPDLVRESQCTVTLHNLFQQRVIPLYTSTHAKYLQSLSNNPQRNFVQTHLFRQMFQCQFLSNVPSAPLVNYATHSHAPPALILPKNPGPLKYLQNVMQHPLLNQTFNNPRNVYKVQFPQSRSNNSPSQYNKKEKIDYKNSKKNKQNNVEKLFMPYMCAEEVEKGLKSNCLLEGVLRINPKQFYLAYVSSTDRSQQDILIDGIKDRNRALEGDIVVVQYIDNRNMDVVDENNVQRQKMGRVVYIKEQVHTRTCIGCLQLMPDKNKQKALFIPRDVRVPRLNIPFLYWPDNFYENANDYKNTLFLAKIIDWYETRFALGKIVCNIGMAGDMKSETKAILAQCDLDITPYGSEFKHLYPSLDYLIPKDEIDLREDCRQLCIFSIDPFNCRDIDDAMSCKKLENGNFEIGVHISDVSHYLKENTPLDEKVAEKATTIYMVERAYHMLPDEMCMLCSLLPGVDKLAFSVFWEITEDGNVLNHRFSKTIINSCSQLAYEHAQSVLDDDEDCEAKFPEVFNGFTFKEVYNTIKVLGKLSSIFRKRRYDGGSLRIDQPKIAFKLNPDGLPGVFSIYESKPSHQLIEEFMLLANMTVAERIYNDHPKLAFLRCHPSPSAYMLNQLAKALKPMGIDLDVSSAGDLHKSLQQHVDPNNPDRGKAMVLNMLCAKPMARAKYFCAGTYDDDFSHYALNVPLYTHFTSPIRRYADIIVHRLLAASLKYREVPKWECDKVHMIAAQCNKQKYNAKRAGELSTELYTLKYIELNSPLITEAVVVDVREKYIDVIIIAMGLNRRIFFNNDFPGEFRCVKNTAGVKLSKMELEWRATDNLPGVKQVIEVFSILKVEMYKGDENNMVKVDTKLVRPQ